MLKKVLFVVVFVMGVFVSAQQAQRIGYIDMAYILENLPEYQLAQSTLNSKAISWQRNIEKQQSEIDDLKSELNNEKALLTEELIADKKEDIQIKELDLKKLKNAYFGSNGDLYVLRQQLVQPVQDLVYFAVQDIAKKRKYDFVLDKTSDLVMLYSNKKYDISELVISSINRSKKSAEIESKLNKNKNKKTNSGPQNVVLDSTQQKKLDERALKKAALQKRIDDQNAAKLKQREELLKKNAEKKQKRIDEIENSKKETKKNTKNN